MHPEGSIFMAHHKEIMKLRVRLKNMRATWRTTSGVFVNVCILGVIGLKQYGGRICRSQMVAYDPLAY